MLSSHAVNIVCRCESSDVQDGEHVSWASAFQNCCVGDQIVPFRATMRKPEQWKAFSYCREGFSWLGQTSMIGLYRIRTSPATYGLCVLSEWLMGSEVGVGLVGLDVSSEAPLFGVLMNRLADEVSQEAPSTMRVVWVRSSWKKTWRSEVLLWSKAT